MNETNALAVWLETLPCLQQELGGNHLWQYLAFILYGCAAIFLSKLVDMIVTKHLTKFATKTKTQLDDVLIKVLHGPLKLVVFILFVHLGVRVLDTPPAVQTWILRVFGLTVAAAFTYFILKLVDAGFELARDNYARADRHANFQILVLLRKALKFFVVLIALLVIADNNGIKITSVLTGLGVTGLAVALAAQETLSNLLGSIVILADHPFRLGDRIRVGTDEGVVDYIGVRSTRLKTPEGDSISIPNRIVTGVAVRNFSKTPPAPPPATAGKSVT